MEIPISADLVEAILKVLVYTQGVKELLNRWPWLVALIEKAAGVPGVSGILTILLAGLVAVLATGVETLADGSVSFADLQLMIGAWIGAVGGSGLLAKLGKRRDPAPE